MSHKQPTDLPHDYELETDRLAKLQSMFIRNVDHELRTPITIIQGYAELLSEGAMGMLVPEQADAIFAITHRARELRTLVERISTFLAVQARVAAIQTFNLPNIVNQVVEAQKPGAEQAGVRLTLHLLEELPPVIAQAYHVQQAVDCLIDNAIKFTPKGGQVEVGLEAEDKWVILTISDTGIGISAKEQERIFDSFYQVDGSLTRPYGGVGLGLTIAKAVIEAYAGQIKVESQPGQGSRFTVKFPAAHFEPRGQHLAMKKVKLQRILIVDDEPAVALTLQAGLEKLPNCEISTATTAERALQLLERYPFDLLITDYRLPGMDGLSLAEHVRRLYPQTIIIMITAYSDDDLYAQAANISIRRVLNKPVTFSEIRQAASELL